VPFRFFRIFSLEKAREFYLDFLGFKLDWDASFGPNSPLFMQVSRGASPFVLASITAMPPRARTPMSR
jgi:catechol 2,3-dioxygenase-like lactoylglutathione lyase family enzyme